MHYKIYSENPSSNFIDIEFILENINTEFIEIQLPAWRPGRYELQNFVKNIQKFEVLDEKNNSLKFKKIKKDRWQIETKNIDKIRIQYNYFAKITNAGSSFVDENILYVNPVNLCVYAEGRIDEECTLELQVSENQRVAGLTYPQPPSAHAYADAQVGVLFRFKDFYDLVDSPFIVSSSLKYDFYEVGGVKFHLWFEGNYAPDFKKIKTNFMKFTKKQLKVFGEFPEPEYHFITWILPTPYYHGVEHRSSTMMVLGPDNQNLEELYIDLLGVASHELFHAWNICKIRPIELFPYDFTKENYFSTCFIAEGVTTYYGDLMLYESGVFDEIQYRKELEARYKQHFDKSDNASQSLLESSFDLWLDGYSEGIPDRKVSVYHKGSIVAQILDLHIRKVTKNKKSLNDVMKLMWLRFGKKSIGYTYQDYKKICEEVAGESLDWYFEKCIEGNESVLEILNKYLAEINLSVEKNENNLVVLKVISSID